MSFTLSVQKIKIEDTRDKIVPILIRHQIQRVGIFSPVAKGEVTSKSDIDIMVELGNKISLLEFVGINFELEDLIMG